jgi:hypothetical protein
VPDGWKGHLLLEDTPFQRTFQNELKRNAGYQKNMPFHHHPVCQGSAHCSQHLRGSLQ